MKIAIAVLCAVVTPAIFIGITGLYGKFANKIMNEKEPTFFWACALFYPLVVLAVAIALAFGALIKWLCK